MKKLNFVISVGVLLLLLGACTMKNREKVVFSDERMAELLALSCGLESTDKITESDLEQIERLNIGYTCYYSSLCDIKKCKNLKALVIGDPRSHYVKYAGGLKQDILEETSDRIKQIEAELEEIFESCTEMEVFFFSDEEEYCNLTAIDFLRHGLNLEVVSLKNLQDVEVGCLSGCSKVVSLALSNCTIKDIENISDVAQVEDLFLKDTNIAVAEELLRLEKLRLLDIRNTELSNNSEEMELIYSRFPDLEIW